MRRWNGKYKQSLCPVNNQTYLIVSCHLWFCWFTIISKKLLQHGVSDVEQTTISCIQFFKIGVNQQSHLCNVAKMTVIPAEAGSQNRRSNQKYWIPPSWEWRLSDTIFHAWHKTILSVMSLLNVKTNNEEKITYRTENLIPEKEIGLHTHSWPSSNNYDIYGCWSLHTFHKILYRSLGSYWQRSWEKSNGEMGISRCLFCLQRAFWQLSWQK